MRSKIKHATVSRRSFLGAAVIAATVCTRDAFGENRPGEGRNETPKMNPRLFTFVAGDFGRWKMTNSVPIIGEGLPLTRRLDVVNGTVSELPAGAHWLLRGVTSNDRYVTRTEKDQLSAKQPALGLAEADCAVLIPIRKNPKWWALTPEERRRIFEEQSHHTATGLKCLPAVARRLHHCRDLDTGEPFDFLTWFEFAKADSSAFDRLLAELRATPEWTFVEREVEIRVFRDGA
jgi:hypothetical protein